MTPAPTRLALLGVLLVTAVGVGVHEASAAGGGTVGLARAGAILWLTTGLFLIRVAGQVLVAVRAPAWLPPMHDWNLTPYRLLLPTQIAILMAMIWLDSKVYPGHGFAPHRTLGWSLIGLSAVYATAMAFRYCLRMTRRPVERWFGGTIPIVFHLVLALYLLTLGGHLAAR